MKRHDTMTENAKNNAIRNLMDKLTIRGAFADEVEGSNGNSGENAGNGEGSQGEAGTGDDTPDFGLLKDKKVANLVQHARTEEKSKVHKDLDKSKAKISTLEGEVTTLTAQVGQLTVENNKLKNDIIEIEKQSKLSADDKVKAIQTALDNTKAELDKVTGELSVMKSKYDSVVLEGYKKSKIAEAGGKVIEELVSGSTTEEIDASVEKAKQAYAKYNPNGGTQQQQQQQQSSGAGSASTGSTGAPARKENEADFSGFTNMLKNPREAKKQASAYAELRNKG